MPIRLVVSDLDGTLFGPDQQLTTRTCESIAAVGDRGIRFVAATGRSHRTAAPRLERATTIETICASNGAVTYDPRVDEIRSSRCIGDETLPVVLDLLQTNFPTMALGWETVDGFGWDPVWQTRRAINLDLADPAWAPGPLDPARHPHLLKIMAWDAEATQAALAAIVSDHLPDDVVCTTSGADFVEITGDGVDKASAVAAWCEIEGIDRSAVVAFGDQHNDITMQQWAGHGVAMGDAHPDVQAIADEIIGTNADDAVAAYLDQI